MKSSLVLILALIIVSIVMISGEPCTLAQPSNKGAIKGQIDNNARLRALMNELRYIVTKLREARQARFIETVYALQTVESHMLNLYEWGGLSLHL